MITLIAKRTEDTGLGRPYEPHLTTIGLFFDNEGDKSSPRKHFFTSIIPHGCCQTWMTLEQVERWLSEAGTVILPAGLERIPHEKEN